MGFGLSHAPFQSTIHRAASMTPLPKTLSCLLSFLKIRMKLPSRATRPSCLLPVDAQTTAIFHMHHFVQALDLREHSRLLLEAPASGLVYPNALEASRPSLNDTYFKASPPAHPRTVLWGFLEPSRYIISVCSWPVSSLMYRHV